jgi:hypothetical protein
MIMKKYIIKPYDCFNKLNTPKNFANSCSHSGDCEANVKGFMDKFELSDVGYSRNYIKSVGIDETEEMTERTVLMYVLWLMACDIREQGEFYFGE